MSDLVQPTGPAAPKEDPEGFALRGKPHPVVRFRRGLIVGVAGAVAAALVAVSWLALQPPSFRRAANALESGQPASRAGADALAGTPKSYADVPRLGPPLPGDLGRPILEHQRATGDAIPGLDSAAADGADARSAAEERRQRLAAARQAARTSPVIVQLAEGAGVATASQLQASVTPAVEPAPAPAGAAAPEQQKVDFAKSSGDINPHELIAQPSPWTLSAGSVIPASLITGLNSDLPGMVLAQVTENVRDSATGQTILIPQGARLIGSYDSAVAYGQRRALLVWTRIVFPDGSSVRLDNMPAADASGYAGLAGKVDSHTWALLKGIALSTFLGVGTQLRYGDSGGELARAIRESTQQTAADAGNRITNRNLAVQPTIEVRPGWPVRVLVSQDLILKPWRG